MSKHPKPKHQSEHDRHFYASSAAEWRVDSDPEELIHTMRRQPYPFTVWRVALPLHADYPIKEYRPDVDPELLTFIGFWDTEDQ